MKSCLSVSPLIKLGVGNESKPAQIDHSTKYEKHFERHKTT